MLNPPSSLAKVLDQLATAPLIVLETPKPFKGCFTEVEIIFIIRPADHQFHHEGFASH